MKFARLWAIAAGICALLAVSGFSVLAKTTVGPAEVGPNIDKLVADGKVAEAVTKLQTSYKATSPEGLSATRDFAIAVLKQGLLEHDPYEKCYAASALAEAGETGGFKILEAAFYSPEPSLKMAAADGLGEVGSASAVALLEKLYHTADARDRVLLLQGLAQATDPSAEPALMEALDNQDRMERLVAIEGLGKMGRPSAIPKLQEVFAKAKEPFEKVSVAHSLLLLGDNSGLSYVRQELSDPGDGDVRAIAALALGDARDASLVPDLKRALSSDPDLEVKMATAVALTHYNDRAGIDYLKATISGDDAISRRHMGQLLERINFEAGRDVLLAAVASQDPNMQLAGLRAIGMRGGEPEVHALGQALNTSHDPILRADVAWALGHIGRPSCIPILLKLVQEKDPAVRYTAADSLEKIASNLLKLSDSKKAQQ